MEMPRPHLPKLVVAKSEKSKHQEKKKYPQAQQRVAVAAAYPTWTTKALRLHLDHPLKSMASPPVQAVRTAVSLSFFPSPADSQPPPRTDSNVLLRTENDVFKRTITAGRSKRDTCQLRDEKNEELIRATIKSVPGFTATDPTVAPILDTWMLTRSRDVAVVEASCSIRSFGLHPRRIADHKDVDISEEEERPKWTCLAKVGNGAVKVLSLINCSDSISESRITTALFHMAGLGSAFLKHPPFPWTAGEGDTAFQANHERTSKRPLKQSRSTQARSTQTPFKATAEESR
eukprot:s9493_g1.t1